MSKLALNKLMVELILVVTK